jgi:hypothetical protein
MIFYQETGERRGCSLIFSYSAIQLFSELQRRRQKTGDRRQERLGELERGLREVAACSFSDDR